MDDQSLSHSHYNCTYHIVFIPKYRRKIMFGELRKEVGEIIGRVCKIEGVTIIKAVTLPDHVHMYVSIPPKESVAKVVGRIKGKSALIFDRHPEYRERYNRHFWARGYYCETIGNVNEETIKIEILFRRIFTIFTTVETGAAGFAIQRSGKNLADAPMLIKTNYGYSALIPAANARCHAANCGRRETRFIFSVFAAETQFQIGEPCTLSDLTAPCRRFV